MVRRRKRNIYGNWVWEDSEANKDDDTLSQSEETQGGKIKLDWRDYVALTIASLETFLLPIVIFVLVIFGIVVALTVIH